jgi:chorismate mutase
LAATHRLLERIVADNELRPDDVASAIFTATTDLDATYPARAAREMGWTQVPLLCMQEMNVIDTLPRCIRVLIHWNTDRAPDEIHHVYLGKARALRPDLAQEKPTEEEGS